MLYVCLDIKISYNSYHLPYDFMSYDSSQNINNTNILCLSLRPTVYMVW